MLSFSEVEMGSVYILMCSVANGLSQGQVRVSQNLVADSNGNEHINFASRLSSLEIAKLVLK